LHVASGGRHCRLRRTDGRSCKSCAWPEKSRTFASRCLISSGILLPGGFFLGGIVVCDGDPGLGIMLVPVGGILLFVAVLLTALGIRSPGTSADDGD